MSLLPDSASFHERVEAFFVAHRGRGVSLSSDDLDLVEAWAAQGVPFEVVARGIRKAAEAVAYDAPDGTGALRSLRAARKRVEAEITKFLRESAGRGTPEAETEPSEPFHHKRHAKLLQALKKLAKAHPETLPVAQRLDALGPPVDFEGANRREELALALLTRALPFAERTSLLREARRVVEKAEVLSAGAKRESLRFHRAAQVRHRWELPAFW